MARRKRQSERSGSAEETVAQGTGTGRKAAAETAAQPGAARSRTKRKSSHKYPLQLTVLERNCLCLTHIRRKFRQRLESADVNTPVLEFTRKELDELDEHLCTEALDAPRPFKRHLLAVLHKTGEILAAIEESEPGTGHEGLSRTAPATGSAVYQFKITLQHIQPPIWRRIQTPDVTLADLHMQIQVAFDWWDDHLHRFEIAGERYGEPMPDPLGFDSDVIDEAKVRLSDLIRKSGRRSKWIYEYDFGDGWRHEIVFEGFAEREPRKKYPRCIDGARAGPPEDCGGPYGYAELLDILSDPSDPEYADRLEWSGPLEPEEFDADAITRQFRRVK